MNRGIDMGKAISAVFAVVILFAAVGCIQAPYKELVYQNPYILDKLYNGATVGSQNGGSFCKTGWSPGATGQLIYDLPGMPQGQIMIETSGLSRIVDGGVFLTLFEPADSQYAEPFITKNPYLATLTVKNYLAHPHSTFDLTWTIKNFPTDTPDNVKYSDQKPEAAYQQTLPSGEVALYPDKTQTIVLTWMNGKARLSIDGKVIIEHNYAPLTLNANALRLVIGQSPGMSDLALDGLVIQKVIVNYPGM